MFVVFGCIHKINKSVESKTEARSKEYERSDDKTERLPVSVVLQIWKTQQKDFCKGFFPEQPGNEAAGWRMVSEGS